MADSYDIREIQSVVLQMLKEFRETCEKLHVHYFMVGGTLLGAVRHQGFVPWDDDIDVGMLRKDYDIFVEKAQELLPEHIFLQTHKTDPGFPHNFAKLRNNKTTYIETTVKNLDMNHGIYIDVFPFDYYPDSKISAALFERKRRWMTRTINKVFCIENKTVPSLKERMKDRIIRLVYPSADKALDRRDRLYRSVGRSTLICNLCGAWGSREIVPAGIFDRLTELPFEGERFLAPERYDEYLTFIYGDYMKLPPSEKRVSHHYTEVIDLDRPYTDYFQKSDKAGMDSGFGIKREDYDKD